MAKTNETIVFDDKAKEYKILSKDSKGAERTRDHVPGIEVMDGAKAVQTFQGFVGKEGTKREAALSLQVAILQGCIAKMEEFRGKADVHKGVLSEGVRDTFRQGEDAYFGAFMDKAHPGHAAYLKALPKVNERNQPIAKDDSVAERHSYFVSRVRKDPSYGNAKNLLLRLWYIAGAHPLDAKRNVILPPEVMKVMIDNALDLTPPDNSFTTKAMELMQALVMPADPKNVPELDIARLPALADMARRFLETIEERKNIAAAQATQRASVGDVVSQTQAAMDAANAKRESAGGPSYAAAKEKVGDATV